MPDSGPTVRGSRSAGGQPRFRLQTAAEIRGRRPRPAPFLRFEAIAHTDSLGVKYLQSDGGRDAESPSRADHCGGVRPVALSRLGEVQLLRDSRRRAPMRLRRRRQLRRNENLGQLQIGRSMRRPGAWRDHLQLQGGQEHKDGSLTRAINYSNCTLPPADGRGEPALGTSFTTPSTVDGAAETVLEPRLQNQKGVRE
jgi:hypothetical protein